LSGKSAAKRHAGKPDLSVRKYFPGGGSVPAGGKNSSQRKEGPGNCGGETSYGGRGSVLHWGGAKKLGEKESSLLREREFSKQKKAVGLS